jgi:hypothetical protein
MALARRSRFSFCFNSFFAEVITNTYLTNECVDL